MTTGVLRPAYIPRCNPCKPGPDGVLPNFGWLLIVIGAAVLLIGVWLLLPSRSDAAPRTPASGKRGWQVVAVGLLPLVLGLIMVGTSGSRVDDDKSQLRSAATELLSHAVNGVAGCRHQAALESPLGSNAAGCGNSPRDYVQGQTDPSPMGVYDITVQYLFSPTFVADGEVTVYDTGNHRSLCVKVPDSDVAAAAQASATPGATALPTDEVSIDPSPYISGGACPDAPEGLSIYSSSPPSSSSSSW